MNAGLISGVGSGFIIDSSGLAVTNNHVVTGAERIEVFVGEDQKTVYPAKLVGGSICSDLAVIDIEGEGFDFLDWSSQAIDFGQEIYSGGYNYETSAFKLSNGIVVNENVDGNTPWTAVDSLFGYSIRTDPRNSGAPVVDKKGNVLGIDYGMQLQGINGVGISTGKTIDIVEELIHDGWIGSFGINGLATTTEDVRSGGVWVISVQSGSAADRAGIRPGDIIRKLDGKNVATGGTLAHFCEILLHHNLALLLPFEILRTASDEVLIGEISLSSLASFSTPYPPSVTPEAGKTPEPGQVVNPDASQPGEIYYDLRSNLKLSEWNQFVTSGDPGGVINTFENGKNLVEIGSLYTYNYYIFKEIDVSNVQLEIEIDNQGVNNNNISLICRYSEAGWYEFNIGSNGLFFIYRYDPAEEEPYALLWSGGSREIKTGKEVNNYISICNENRLTLKINGKEKITVKDSNFTSGNIGFAISSYNVLPVIVNVNKLIASVPE